MIFTNSSGNRQVAAALSVKRPPFRSGRPLPFPVGIQFVPPDGDNLVISWTLKNGTAVTYEVFVPGDNNANLYFNLVNNPSTPPDAPLRRGEFYNYFLRSGLAWVRTP